MSEVLTRLIRPRETQEGTSPGQDLSRDYRKKNMWAAFWGGFTGAPSVCLFFCICLVEKCLLVRWHEFVKAGGRSGSGGLIKESEKTNKYERRACSTSSNIPCESLPVRVQLLDLSLNKECSYTALPCDVWVAALLSLCSGRRLTSGWLLWPLISLKTTFSSTRTWRPVNSWGWAATQPTRGAEREHLYVKQPWLNPFITFPLCDMSQGQISPIHLPSCTGVTALVCARFLWLEVITGCRHVSAVEYVTFPPELVKMSPHQLLTVGQELQVDISGLTLSQKPLQSCCGKRATSDPRSVCH